MRDREETGRRQVVFGWEGAVIGWMAATVLVAAGPAQGQEAVAPSPEVAARVADFRADLVELKERLGIPGLSVAVTRGGEVVWAEGLGWADLAAERPARADTPYRIASITKTMTAAVVVELAAEGRLELDAPVARVLEGGPEWTRRVTVRQLLSHTSESEPPGSVFAYSGRYNVLAWVAEEAAGRSFGELLVERVMEPAGMARSYPVSLAASARARAIRGELATPYLPSGEPAPAGMLPDETSGGNGVVSTVLDLVRWVEALESGAVVGPEMLEALWMPTLTPAGDSLSYGLGWWVEETPALRLVYHGGQWPVYSGMLVHVRGVDLTLAILANHWGVSQPFYGIGTGTALYPSFAASFLRHFALDDAFGDEPPRLPWDAPANSLAALAASEPTQAARHHLGAELFGRGLVARAVGDDARADSLLRAAANCCPSALAASDDLGLLFHLGRSNEPSLQDLGRAAGERRLARFPGDPTTRFNLGIAHLGTPGEERGVALLHGLYDHPGDEVPLWMWSWSGYLLAEHASAARPAAAREMLERVLAEGEDEGGLFGEARALLEELEKRR